MYNKDASVVVKIYFIDYDNILHDCNAANGL